MPYIRYLCLFTYNGVKHILCCVFVLFVFVLCFVYPVLPVSLDCTCLIVPLVTIESDCDSSNTFWIIFNIGINR